MENRFERLKGHERPHFAVVPSVNELLTTVGAQQCLPIDREIHTQGQRRSEICEITDRVYSDLGTPCTGIDEAIKAGTLDPGLASKFYDSLREILSDADYHSLIYYLPFEVLPDVSSLASSGNDAAEFIEAYRKAWFLLLGQSSVRANFVDGDVLEVGLRDGDLRRVIKATHLIPGLLQKGIITRTEIERLIREDKNGVLSSSLIEMLALPGHYENGKLHPLKDMDDIVRIALGALNGAEFAGDYAPTLRRGWWLREKAIDRCIDECAEDVSALLLANDHERIQLGLRISGSSIELQKIYLRGAMQAVSLESAKPDSDGEQAAWLVDLIRTLWDQEVADREELSTLFRKCYHLGVVGLSDLEKRGIAIPELAGRFSKNLENMQVERERVEVFLGAIASSPFLADKVLPIANIYGSRLKGYGTYRSDIDIGIFLTPSANYDDREEIRKHILAAPHAAELTPVEFWLKENGYDLQIVDHRDHHAGDEFWSHMLCNGAWLGDPLAINELYVRLILPYMRGGHAHRSYYIERLEQDALQYRLLHKGYRRFFPDLPRPDWTNAPEVDGNSAFWDPGYRWLATRLYLRTVFLPRQ